MSVYFLFFLFIILICHDPNCLKMKVESSNTSTRIRCNTNSATSKKLMNSDVMSCLEYETLR